MFSLRTMENFTPNSLTPSTAFFTRASFGGLAAYIASINPIAGLLVLLTHGAWECADLLIKSEIAFEKQRIDAYTKAFSQLCEKAGKLNSSCIDSEIEKAKNIFFVHNLIEEICYKALPEAVAELKIRSDEITEEQSRIILAKVKDAAHVELRKDGGYSKKGREMITPAQLDFVVNNVSTIIHDRDGRLTDARYSSLTDLCLAIDDHNNYVKNILFKSWFRCGSLSSDTHLPMIKNLVEFNKRMTFTLGFDFEEALLNKKKYYDNFHPKIREIECQETHEKSALKFVNLTEIRAKFSSYTEMLLECRPDRLLTDCLSTVCGFHTEQVAALFRYRSLNCEARYGLFSTNKITQPPLLTGNPTVGEFLSHYFPERVRNINSQLKTPPIKLDSQEIFATHKMTKR